MLKKLFQRLGRYRIIMDRVNGEPYLERYYVFLKDRKRFPFNVFVHKFLKSDPDDVHDHPWPYATLILKGGYYEWTPQFDADGNKINEVARWCGAGSFRWAGANTYHRVELDPAVNVGPCSCPVSSKETGASWFAINGCSGNNIWQTERPAYD
jgi:hypothetical protein